MWQVSHGAFVMTCRGGLPGAPNPLWQEAHRPRTDAWLNREVPDVGPFVDNPGLMSPRGEMAGPDVPAGATGAILARPELPRTDAAGGGATGAVEIAGGAIGPVADGANTEVEAGLLLKKTLALPLGDVAGVDCAGLAAAPGAGVGV